MKRVLIGGAHSFVGTALEEQLNGSPDRFSVGTLPLHETSLEEFDFHGADALVQVAAIVHRKETARSAPLYRAVNRDLALAAARKAKAEGVRQFVYLSSLSVYGAVTGTIAADTEPRPRTQYGCSKLEAEQALAALADDSFTVTILRPPMVIGSGAKGNYARLVRLTRALPFCPDFENRRTLVRIGTLCETIEALLETPRSGIFFPQEAQPSATRDLIEEIAAAQGRTLRRSTVLNPAIRLLIRTTAVGKKLFGDLVLDALTELPLPACKEAQP